MSISQYLIRLAPEITLKSRPVQQRFESQLINNIKDAFDRIGATVKISCSFSRMYIETDEENEFLFKKIFGISSYSKLDARSSSDMDSIKKVALQYKDCVSGKTFAVRAKRIEVKEYTSLDVEREVGSVLSPYAKGVDLTNPDIYIFLDINKERTFFFFNKKEGLGGLPLGVEGKSLCLISGGFDSAVAAWKMFKRGVKLDFLFCNLAGSMYEKDLIGITKELCDSWSFGYNPKLYIINFTRVVEDIQKNVYNPYAQVVLKRAFYKAANVLSDKLKVDSIVTGESIGQVSSQTLANLTVIDRAISKLVVRPLVTEDKVDIINLSRKIGMYHLVEHIKEYCDITKKHPITVAKLVSVEKEELKLNNDLIKESVDNAKIINLSSFNIEKLIQDYFFIDNIPDKAIVIDSRSKDLYDKWHYPEAIHIDFYDLAKDFKSLDKDKTYVIYCPFGVKSALIAEKMQEIGFKAYSFKDGVKGLKKYLNNFN